MSSNVFRYIGGVSEINVWFISMVFNVTLINVRCSMSYYSDIEPTYVDMKKYTNICRKVEQTYLALKLSNVTVPFIFFK